MIFRGAVAQLLLHQKHDSRVVDYSDLFRQSQSRENCHTCFRVHTARVHVGRNAECLQAARLVVLTLLTLFSGLALLYRKDMICRPSGTDKKRMEGLLPTCRPLFLSPSFYRIHLRRSSWFPLHRCPLSLARQKLPLLRRKPSTLSVPHSVSLLSPFFHPQFPQTDKTERLRASALDCGEREDARRTVERENMFDGELCVRYRCFCSVHPRFGGKGIRKCGSGRKRRRMLFGSPAVL